MCSTRFSKSGIFFSSPLVSLVVISLKKTPDLVHGSRNLMFSSSHIFAPLLSSAHACVSVSKILFASSGGVKTSSLERLAMHVSTAGFRFLNLKLARSMKLIIIKKITT